MTGLEVELLVGDGALRLLDQDWDGLLLRQALPNPTLTSTWQRELRAWEEGSPAVGVARTGGELVAGGCFGIRRAGGPVGPRIATWLGDERLRFSSDFLLDPDAPPDAAAALIRALFDVADAVHLSVPVGRSLAAMRLAAPWLRVHASAEGWVATVPPARAGYARKRTEKDVRQARRSGADVTLRTACEATEVTAALERLFEIHRDRWRDRPDEIARFSTTHRHREWHRGAIGAMARSDRVRVAEVYEGARLVASALGLATGRGAAAYVTAARRDAALSEAGHLVLQELIRALEGGGVKEIDLGVGACEPGGPKARLGPRRVEVVALFAASSPRSQRRLEAARRLKAGLRKLRA